jgi:hypothetical protein
MVSHIKIPTQEQLRDLASTLNRSNLLDLGLISDEDELLRPAELFTKLKHITAGETREKIWSLATGVKKRDSDEEIAEFTIFNQLPFDLRDEIWKIAARTNNLIELTWQNLNARWWCTPFCRFSPPAVFSVCRESRESTRIIREKEFVNAFGTVVNVHNDLLFLHSVDEELNRRFMNFCMDLYESRGNDGEMMKKLPRLAISWMMWEDMLNDDDDNDDLSVHGEHGLLRENLKGLKELVLVHVMIGADQNERLYRDERVLVEEELLDVMPKNFSGFALDPEAVLKEVRDNLKYTPEECRVVFKTLLRGDDGEGGAMHEFLTPTVPESPSVELDLTDGF